MMKHHHDLVRVFAGLYPTTEDQRRFARSIPELDWLAIHFSSSALNSWSEILAHAEPRRALRAVFEHALKENARSEDLKALFAIVVEREPGEWRIDRQPGFDWRAHPGAQEKILGEKSTLVDVAYLVRGAHCARSVAKVVLRDGSGTGFLTHDDLLITNHHVLPTEEEARSATALFGYERLATGLGDGHPWALRDADPDRCPLDPGSFFRTSEELDTTVVRVTRRPMDRWGALTLRPLGDPNGLHLQRVNIIQHPGGAPKQVSLAAGVVAYVGGGRVQYLTDTLPGSSGSPVFDEQWRVVALHHAGGQIEEPGTANGARFRRNEGILINDVCELIGA